MWSELRWPRPRHGSPSSSIAPAGGSASSSSGTADPWRPWCRSPTRSRLDRPPPASPRSPVRSPTGPSWPRSSTTSTRPAGGRGTGPRPRWTEPVFCFDTDVLSATMRREPSLALIRRLALVPPVQPHTTAITVGELLYGAARVRRPDLVGRVQALLAEAVTVLPFDAAAAGVYARLRAGLETE